MEILGIDKTVARTYYYLLKGVAFFRNFVKYFLEEFVMVFEKIRKILSEQLDIEEDKITLSSNIVEDLGADSLDIVDLLMSLEDEFDVEVPDEEIENIKTIGDMVNYIENNK